MVSLRGLILIQRFQRWKKKIDIAGFVRNVDIDAKLQFSLRLLESNFELNSINGNIISSKAKQKQTNKVKERT